MHYPDLTPYEYGSASPQANVLNVGWLSVEHPFPNGAVDDRMVAALRKLVEHPVNLYRGRHICEFCPPPRKFISPGGLPMAEPLPGTAGNGEIRVSGSHGIVYVAPVLVLHYVIAHQYLPPAEFIEAAIEAASAM